MSTRQQQAEAVLQGLNDQITQSAVDFLVAVQSFEDSTAANNPEDTTLNEPGATDYNSSGVKNYPTFTEGVDATVATLNEASYAGIRVALRGNDTTLMANELAAGGWAGTEPEEIAAYSRDLQAMVATVQADRSKYYNVEVSSPKESATSSESASSSDESKEGSSGASESSIEQDIAKDEAALKNDISKDEAAAKAKESTLVGKLHQFIDVHEAEINDLLKEIP